MGNEDWLFPVPIPKWTFDAEAGRQELFNRRIGGNELDAIDICHGYVDAHYEYAYQKRQGFDVNGPGGRRIRGDLAAMSSSGSFTEDDPPGKTS